MGGAFFFMSARSRRFSFRRCAAIHASACVACFSIRGVHLIALDRGPRCHAHHSRTISCLLS